MDAGQDHAEITAVLWDLVRQQGVTRQKDVLQKVLNEDRSQKLLRQIGSTPEDFRLRVTATNLSQDIYDNAGFQLETPIVVPLAPALSLDVVEMLADFRFLPLHIAQITEEQYPKDFVKPLWDRSDERIPLIGQWVAIEEIAKPNWNDPAGYPNDRLMRKLGVRSRFATSWESLRERMPKNVRLTTVEEWNFFANCINWLRVRRSMTFPDLGTTNSWELCANIGPSGYRCMVGSSRNGGLAGVRNHWPGHRSDITSFRVLVDL